MYPLHDKKECKGTNCPEHGKNDDWTGTVVFLFMLVVGFLLLYWR